MDLKFITYRFWYFVWFIAIPALAAALSALVLRRLEYFDGPWHVLLAFALFAILAYTFRDRLPWWSSPEEKISVRRLRKEGKHLAKETNKLLRRHSKKLSPDVRKLIAQHRTTLLEALEESDAEAIKRALRKLDTQVERHLAFARKSTAREYAESIGVAVLVALLLRAFVVEAFKIPSGSMIPTLQVGDHIFVNKFIYGLRIPLTYWYVEHNSSPRRGDVIVFAYPQDESTDFIKRIVGVGGDVLEMRDGVLYVNGQEMPRCPVREVEYNEVDDMTDRERTQRGQLYVETMDRGDGETIQYYVLYNAGMIRGEDWGPERVPPGQVYVMGDNRDNSLDSRRWGGVPIENIKGRAWIIWWSNGPSTAMSPRFDTIMDVEPEMTSQTREALEQCESAR